jgi:hypothetical protein
MNPRIRFTIFSTDGFSGGKNFKMCVVDIYVLSGLIRVNGPSYSFNLWIGPGFLFEFYS